METAKVAQPLGGEKLYQQRARRALPILVRQAQAGATIFYADLATELGMPNPRNLNYPLGSIGESLQRLSKEWNEPIPAIQCLVINKNTQLPGKGVGWFLSPDKPAQDGHLSQYEKLSRRQQREVVQAQLQNIFSYPKWNEVLEALNLEPVAVNYSGVLEQATHYYGGGESEQHKQLKQYVAHHPEVLHLPPHLSPGEIEYSLPSGDTLDVLFQHGADWIAAEVKSSLSGEGDLVRGLFQCIKYRAVIEAYQATAMLPQNARVVLVLEGHLPGKLLPMKNMLGIEVIEHVKPLL